MGSLLGTAAFGCGDAPGSDDGSTVAGTTGDDSTGPTTTGDGPGTSSSGEVPTTSGATGDGPSSTGDGSSSSSNNDGSSSTGDGSSTSAKITASSSRTRRRTASGGGKTNLPNPFLKTLWHRCDDAGIDSRIYFGDVPWVAGAFPLVPTVWGKLADDVNDVNLNSLTNPNTLTRFFDDAASGDLPNFAIIDPGFTSNDDHPSHNIQLGRLLIGSIYKALAEGPAWKKTLLIITYDEHGGFYDHVPPPKTIDELAEFEQLGFCVPTMVIGPSVRRGCINGEQFEHCSIGATLMKRFGIAPLNDRMAQARDVSSCIHPDYIDDPQPGPPIPLVDVSISDILASVGHTTSQEELFLAAGVTIDEAFTRKGQADTMRLLLRAQKLGVARLRP